MPKPPDLNGLIARNLRFFMERNGYKSARRLAADVGLSASFVQYLLKPKTRPTTTVKTEGFPTLDKLAQLISKFPKTEVWMLLHPDIEKQITLMEMYDRIEADYQKNIAPKEKEKQNA